LSWREEVASLAGEGMNVEVHKLAQLTAVFES
jgi:hypothetical protein